MGTEIVIQGKVIRSPEHLVAEQKRAWLFLHQSLRQTDERFKCLKVPVPVSLEEDYDIECALSDAKRELTRFNSLDNYKEYIAALENHYDEETIRASIQGKVNREREQWALARIQAENPLTVLDVGGGYGEIALYLGRKNYQVTTLTPNVVATKLLEEARVEENIPIQAIPTLLEEFNPKNKFDVVFCGEVLEHVVDPQWFLQRCVDLATRAVVVTTPKGSCEMSFQPNGAWRTCAEHVYCWGPKSIRALIDSVVGAKLNGEIHEVASCLGMRGQVIKCYGFVLVKDGGHHESKEGYGSEYPEESQRGACGEIREEEVVGEQGGEQADAEAERRENLNTICS